MKIISSLILISYFAFFLISIASGDDPECCDKERSNDQIVLTVKDDQILPEPQALTLTVLPRPSLAPPREDSERPDHQCGRGFDNSPCGPGRCCSVNGWCGNTDEYCRGSRCRYQCWESSTEQCPNCLPKSLLRSDSYYYYHYGVSQIVSESIFDSMFKHRKDCPSHGFYSYDAFITAAISFPGFGTTGDVVTRKREVAAFLGQTSQATTGQWSYSEHSWGYCHINKSSFSNYCTSPYWPCARGKKYNARGPIQLTHNHNYGLAGEALGLDLINNPDLVATDPVVSFKTALWFWMTHHDNKPSCHNILVKANSKARGYYDVPIGYGHIGSIIKGQSSIGANSATTSVGYYKRYCDMLGVSYGERLKYWYDHDETEDDERTYFDVAETEISSAESDTEMKWEAQKENHW